ncbi:hypothetical protein ACYSNO_03270 [Enterococcus sp. LJL98]
MKEEKNYPYKDSYTGEIVTILAILLIGILGVIALIKWVIIPNFISIINWFVPNFWSLFGYFIIIWIFFKFLKFLWYPVYSFSIRKIFLHHFNRYNHLYILTDIVIKESIKW